MNEHEAECKPPPENHHDFELTKPTAPIMCYLCGYPALNPVRDEDGLWAWSCCEGCNP